jgi:acetoin utilization protein AcuC
VAYIDLDVHHGDGVQAAFYHTDQVLTISLHETGHTLFPGTGYEYETGEGSGEGYSVNLPFPPFTDDATYLWAFEAIVPPLIQGFKPDVVVSQLGVDTFCSDPLANLQLTLSGFEQAVRRIKGLAPHWVALGGGGYDISNVARAWTLAWAVMNDVEVDDNLPEAYQEMAAKFGIHGKKLREEPAPSAEGPSGGGRREMERVVDYLQKKIFPRMLG